MTDFSEILQGKTPGRCFLNTWLQDIDLEYPVLDIGGGEHWSYHRHLKSDHSQIVSINLPSAENIDVIADACSTFPFKDETFNSALCFNLLEHIYNFQTTIREAYRVLQPRGILYIGVPFLHRIHGSPHDYTRFTRERLHCDLDVFDAVKIEELNIGPISAATSLAFPVFKFNLLKYLSWKVATKVDQLIHRINDVLEGTYPLYYVVKAKK